MQSMLWDPYVCFELGEYVQVDGLRSWERIGKLDEPARAHPWDRRIKQYISKQESPKKWESK